MEFKWLVVSFLALMFVVCGVIIFVLRWVFLTSTEGAIKRLNEDIAKANQKQMELNQKIKQADEELAKRQAEARDLANKMKADAEEQSKQEREKIIAKARAEGEEIIAKAQGSKDKIRQELEKEVDVKIVEYSMKIMNDILTEKSMGALNDTMVSEFVENLKNVDMSRISLDVKEAELVTIKPVDDKFKTQISATVKSKINRDIVVKSAVDHSIGGGAMLKFGSLALDGTVRNSIREAALTIKQKIESR